MPKVKTTKEQRKAIRKARKVIEQALKLDANEAETRKRVDRIFEWVMGYDALKHISREYAVRGPGETEYVDFAVQLEPGQDVEPVMLVELKRVGIELAKKHLKQITEYARDAGCEWLLLTNGKEWRVYHVEFGQPPKTEIYESWDLLGDDIDDIVRKFELINYKSIKRGLLNKNWERVKVLKPETLLAAIISPDTFRVIRRNLRKDTGVRVDDEEVHKGITKLLNEAAGKVIPKLKTPVTRKRTQKPKTNDQPKGKPSVFGNGTRNKG